jgi:hypothetical protein
MTFWQFSGRDSRGLLPVVGAVLMLLDFVLVQVTQPITTIKPGLSELFRMEYLMFIAGAAMLLAGFGRVWLNQFTTSDQTHLVLPNAVTVVGIWIAAVVVAQPSTYTASLETRVVLGMVFASGLLLAQFYWLMPLELAWREYRKTHGDTSGAKRDQATVAALSNHRPGH